MCKLISIVMRSFNTKHEAAYTKLYKEYRPKALVYAMLRCSNNKMVAEDIVQEMFLKLWLRRDKIVEIEHLHSYLFIMIRNETVSFLRRQGLHQKLQSYYGQQLNHSTSHDALLEKEYRERLIKVIARLPEQQSLVYELHCVYNWKYSKVAAAMELSPSTVKQHLQAVRRKLMKMVA